MTWSRWSSWIALVLVILWISGYCSTNGQERSFVILAINDVYRIEGVDEQTVGGLARLRTLREQLEAEYGDVLVLHAGDFLYPSLLSRMYDGKQMIEVLNRLDGDGEAFDDRLFVTFGNHEFDADKLKNAETLAKRIEESQFGWVSSNVTFGVCLYEKEEDCLAKAPPYFRDLKKKDQNVKKEEKKDQKLWNRKIVPMKNGLKIGLLGLTIDTKEPKYVEKFGFPEDVALNVTQELRDQGAHVVIALTHLTMAQDKEILEKLGPAGPDLIIGGHEHNQQNKNVGGRWVIKADADLRTATVAQVTVKSGNPPDVDVKFQYVTLGPILPKPDTHVAEEVKKRIEEHDVTYCTGQSKKPKESLKEKKKKFTCLASISEVAGCLDHELGKTQVELVGEELEIRRFETNLGNWIADQARAAIKAPDKKPKVAFINSGGLRLNQNIPRDSKITLRHLEEIFQYPSELKLVKIKGETLQKVVERAVEDWTGNGWWLQISGFSFRHDPKSGRADQLMLWEASGSRPIKPEEEIYAVVNEFLINPAQGDQDGYTMLSLDQEVSVSYNPELLDLVCEGLKAAGTNGKDGGIAPKVEGRICNTTRPQHCRQYPSP